MSDFEVPEAIICSPFEEPTHHWRLEEGAEPEKRPGRRPAIYYYPDPLSQDSAGTRRPKGTAIELKLVNLIRSRVKEWRAAGYPGVTRTTLELLNYWRRDGRGFRFFFAQLEAVETIIFLNEARRDLAQGIDIPLDEPSEQQKAERGLQGLPPLCLQDGDGFGQDDRHGDARGVEHPQQGPRPSECAFLRRGPGGLPERDDSQPARGAGSASSATRASTGRRTSCPPHLMPDLTQGHVLVTNWHVFEPQTSQAGGVSGRVVKAGRRETVPEIIHIGPKTTTARGRRYLTQRGVQSSGIASG